MNELERIQRAAEEASEAYRVLGNTVCCGHGDYDQDEIRGRFDRAFRILLTTIGMRSATAEKRAVERFNREHPIGTEVRYWPGLRWRDDGETEVEAKTGKTRSEASVLGGHTAVVWIEGHAECLALSHVEVVPVSDKPNPE